MARGKIRRGRYNSRGFREYKSSGGSVRDWNTTQSVGGGMVTVSIRGVNETVSWLRSLGEDLEDAIIEGLEDAGEYTIDRIKYVIDEGNFEPLAEPTPEIESRMGATYPNDILKMTGELYNSFDFTTVTAGRKYTLQVFSECDHLAYNVFGVPKNGWGRRVPSRDPLSVTTKRFNSSIRRKIETPVLRALRNS